MKKISDIMENFPSSTIKCESANLENGIHTFNY